MSKLALYVFIISWGIVGYTYFVYPLLLALIAWVSPAKDTRPAALPDDELPHVTMLVAAYNEAEVLSKKLDNTWAIDYPKEKFTLLVGSDGSTDQTARILTQCSDPRLRAFTFDRRRGKASVLNDLVEQANDELLVMSDANTMYAPDAVRRLVAHFADPAVGCVSGELHLEQDGGVSGEGIYWRYENWIKRNSSRLGFLIGSNGGIYALRKAAYMRLNENTIVDDFVITLRVLEQGYRVSQDPFARATEPPCASCRQEMVRKTRIGAGDWQAIGMTSSLLNPRFGLVCLAYWSHKIIRWTLPFFILTGLAANFALTSNPLLLGLLGLQICGIFISVLAATTSFGTWVPKPLRAVTYFYLMNFSLLCGFWRFVTNSQRVTWERGAPRSVDSRTASTGK
ncbi:MAG: glycosyltransferase family 2 protein [Capsulimonadaceae bacterium]|nr:glycosyltransferase family 2 protein [Capsulimonadaceae bacterium]